MKFELGQRCAESGAGGLQSPIMQTILLASGNTKKLAELRALVSDLPVRFLSPADLPLGLSDVEEDRPDFLGNAEKKALAAAADVAVQLGGGDGGGDGGDGGGGSGSECIGESSDARGGGSGGGEIWVLADDSGLCVDALDGAPGVRSARYSGTEGIGKDGANNEKLLRAMEGVAEADRGAAFHCVIAVARKGEILFTVEGSVRGRILHKADGVDGFGYDPLFFHVPSNTSFARLGAAEKAAVSHRGMAVVELRARLAELLGG